MAQPVTPGAKVYIISYRAYGDPARFKNRLHSAAMEGIVGVYSDRQVAQTATKNYLVDYLQKELNAWEPPLKTPAEVREMKLQWVTTEGTAVGVWWYDCDGPGRGMKTSVREWVVR